MKTARPIEYMLPFTGPTITIPAGTLVVPADNLPDGGYWAESWKGMTDAEEGHARNYGFHIRDDEVTE